MNKLAEFPDPEPQRTDFLESVRTPQRVAPNEAHGHRSCSLVNMGAIALRLNRRELNYDAATGTFKDDPEANAMIYQPMRGSWHL